VIHDQADYALRTRTFTSRCSRRMRRPSTYVSVVAASRRADARGTHPAGPEPEIARHYTRLSQMTWAIDSGTVPARELYDEVQPEVHRGRGCRPERGDPPGPLGAGRRGTSNCSTGSRSTSADRRDGRRHAQPPRAPPASSPVSRSRRRTTSTTATTGPEVVPASRARDELRDRRVGGLRRGRTPIRRRRASRRRGA